MAGFGGAIKNISIGLGSSEGKAWIHSGGTGGSMWGGEQDAFLEAMAEAGKSVSDYLGHGERIVYVWYYFEVQLRQIAGYWILGMVVGSLAAGLLVNLAIEYTV